MQEQEYVQERVWVQVQVLALALVWVRVALLSSLQALEEQQP